MASCWDIRTNYNVGRYVQRDNVFKTDRFLFKCDKVEAWSYDWWLFVKMDKTGTIYFNDARYSMQTSFHQEMATNVLKLHFGKVNKYNQYVMPKRVKYVYIREGLQALDEAIKNRTYTMLVAEYEQTLPRHKSRKDTIDRCSKQIQQYQELQKAFGEKVTRLSKEQVLGIKKSAMDHVNWDLKRNFDKRIKQKEAIKALISKPNIIISRDAAKRLGMQINPKVIYPVVSKEIIRYFIDENQLNLEASTNDPVNFDPFKPNRLFKIKNSINRDGNYIVNRVNKRNKTVSLVSV